MRKPKLHCLVMDLDAEVTASLDAALRQADVLLEKEVLTAAQQVLPILKETRPHLLFCPHLKADRTRTLLEAVRRHSPDTVLVWVSRVEWQGLATWLMGVEACTLPLHDLDCFSQSVAFIVHYARLKHEFRQCKQLLGVAEIRCHWLVDCAWEPVAYLVRGMHVYANHAYLTALGFNSLDEVRSMPVLNLVETEERAAFEALIQEAATGNKPSSRLLTTLWSADGYALRAEVRFIPAVLQGRRCVQMHVHPLERQLRKPAVRHDTPSPWGDSHEEPIRLAQVGTIQEGQREAGMRPHFPQAMRLREDQPDLWFAEPGFRQKDGTVTGYVTLIEQLDSTDSRFRLDYWNLGQALQRMASISGKSSGHLIFVSLGDGIFNNESYLKRLLELLNTNPEASGRIVLALDYTLCLQHASQMGKLLKLLQAVGVQVALDQVPDDRRPLTLIGMIKPVFVRFAPGWVSHASQDATGMARLRDVINSSSASGAKVILGGIGDVETLNWACSLPVAYLQGSTLEHE